LLKTSARLQHVMMWWCCSAHRRRCGFGRELSVSTSSIT
jgi:hypothetical protein